MVVPVFGGRLCVRACVRVCDWHRQADVNFGFRVIVRRHQSETKTIIMSRCGVIKLHPGLAVWGFYLSVFDDAVRVKFASRHNELNRNPDKELHNINCLSA